MSENVRADIPSLERANNKLSSFKINVLNQCQILESCVSAASSFCKDDQSRLAIKKLNSAIADIRESLGAVQPAKEHILELIEDIHRANQVEM